MNLYSYIAFNNPNAAKAICHKFGYRVANVKSKEDLAECLRSLVSEEGEPALKAILENHPDKELILEVYGSPKIDHFLGADGTGVKQSGGCGCSSCKDKQRENYANADASQTRLATQTNVIILAAALFLAVAIISKK